MLGKLADKIGRKNSMTLTTFGLLIFNTGADIHFIFREILFIRNYCNAWDIVLEPIVAFSSKFWYFLHLHLVVIFDGVSALISTEWWLIFYLFIYFTLDIYFSQLQILYNWKIKWKYLQNILFSLLEEINIIKWLQYL